MIDTFLSIAYLLCYFTIFRVIVRPGLMYYLLFSKFDHNKYWANFQGIGRILSNVNNIPDKYTLHDAELSTLNMPVKKDRFWSTDLTDIPGQVIRERFYLDRVQVSELRRNSKMLSLKLSDKTGCVNAKLFLDTRIMSLPEIYNCIKYCESALNQVVVISGKVEVQSDDNLNLFASGGGSKIITINMHPDQRQNLLICPKKYIIEEDYLPF